VKTISAALQAHLSQPYQTMATCVRIGLRNGTILRFTALDKNLIISGYAGRDTPLNGTYLAYAGFFPSDIQTSDSLNVANLELAGPMVSPSILDQDVAAGLWDYAAICVFQVNWQDLTMGPLYERVGRSGEISTYTGLGSFKQEMRGLAQYYSRTLVELTSPLCLANVGDARCKVAMGPFTVSSTVTGINADNTTFYDSARNEAGPGAGIAITGITNANPGVVTMADASLNLFNNQPVTLSTIVGMPKLNVVTIAKNPSGTTFQLTIDTTSTAVYGTYASGGLVTPYGGSSAGYFDFGLVTWLTGLNAGAPMEVKAFVPKQVTLQLPMPYLIQIGDTYTMTAGCDRRATTCRSKFSNFVNFRGFERLPGIDKMVQVGRQT
jgi:hypothetical protein